jgi:hypothetical protein
MWAPQAGVIPDGIAEEEVVIIRAIAPTVG